MAYSTQPNLEQFLTQTPSPAAESAPWSESALKVLKERYLRKNEKGEVTETPDALCWRVARALAAAEAKWSTNAHERQAVADSFYGLLARREFLPNSPTLMNAGMNNGLQWSACFCEDIPDSLEGIYTTLMHAAIIAQSGGGIGHCFSDLREHGANVRSTQGVASGPISFLDLYDKSTAQIVQGGKRRGANMATFHTWHPDLMQFIHCKDKQPDGSRRITNFNISVLADDAFMQAVKDGTTCPIRDPRTKEVIGQRDAREVFQAICEAAWRTGDPGLLFIDRANRSASNPIPKLETLKTTNPCLIGSTRLATNLGLVTLEELYRTQQALRVTVDRRATVGQLRVAGGGTVAQAGVLGVETYAAHPVRRTGVDVPVLKLTTAHGSELTATPYHKFLTPDGMVELQHLREGDVLYLQSDEGQWSADRRLPAMDLGVRAQGRMDAKMDRGQASPPTEWSRELGEVLGLLMGNGFVRWEEDRAYAGITLADQDLDVQRTLNERMQRWFGTAGTKQPGSKCTAQHYAGSIARFFMGLGVTTAKAPEKRVPNSVFLAPRDAVIGFLRGLFSADGSVQCMESNKQCSVRLATSSHGLALDVQHLLGNFGIVSRVYLRRTAGRRLLPDSKRVLKEYECAAQYEVIIGAENREVYASVIGFMQPRQQRKLTDWNSTHTAYSEPFTTKVRSIEPAGRADVYCTTVPGPHSMVCGNVALGNCGEIFLGSHDACNLGSLNLGKFIRARNTDNTRELDYAELRAATRIAIRLLDNVVELSPFPLPQITEKVHSLRRLGLGVMGWADTLFQLRIAYDSVEARALAIRVMQTIAQAAEEESTLLAKQRGVFPLFNESIYHGGPERRNGQLTAIAPTGTISIIADCSSGIEPVFALAYKHIVDRGKPTERVLTIANQTFKRIAEQEGFWSPALEAYVAEHGTLAGFNLEVDGEPRTPKVPDWAFSVFRCANEMSVEAHVLMQAAWQKHVDNGISKSVNLPNSATIDDIRAAYLLAYSSGCKGITVFRDGCLDTGQVLNVGKTVAAAPPEPPVDKRPAPTQTVSKRPGVLPARVAAVQAPEGKLFVTMSEKDNEPFEVFLSVGKAGSDIDALAEAIGRLTSLALRVPSTLTPWERVTLVVEQLEHIGGSRSVGFGKQRIASLPDALAKALKQIGKVAREEEEEASEEEEAPPVSKGSAPASMGSSCPVCGNMTLVREEGCKKCHYCSYSEC